MLNSFYYCAAATHARMREKWKFRRKKQKCRKKQTSETLHDSNYMQNCRRVNSLRIITRGAED